MLAENIWILTISCLGLLTAVFAYVVINSGEQEEYSVVQEKWYSFRFNWVVFLFGLGAAVTVISMTPFPVSDQRGVKNASVVNVVGYQWYWDIDNTSFSVGETVEFHVTSGDATHGFGIYNSDNQMLTQTQAMPGYVNKVVHTFDKPGTYKILCLEYCGLAHHGMVAELTVL